MEKFYFMGYYYPIQEVKATVMRVAGFKLESLKNEIELNEAIDLIVHGDPTVYSRFARAMYSLRQNLNRSSP